MNATPDPNDVTITETESRKDKAGHWTEDVMRSWFVHLPSWARITMGLFAAMILLMIFSGTLQEFNRVVGAIATRFERSAENQRFDRTLKKMVESVSKLEGVTEKLTAHSRQLERIDERLLDLTDDIHWLDKRLHTIETAHKVTAPEKTRRSVRRRRLEEERLRQQAIAENRKRLEKSQSWKAKALNE